MHTLRTRAGHHKHNDYYAPESPVAGVNPELPVDPPETRHLTAENRTFNPIVQWRRIDAIRCNRSLAGPEELARRTRRSLSTRQSASPFDVKRL